MLYIRAFRNIYSTEVYILKPFQLVFLTNTCPLSSSSFSGVHVYFENSKRLGFGLFVKGSKVTAKEAWLSDGTGPAGQLAQTSR